MPTKTLSLLRPPTPIVAPAVALGVAEALCATALALTPSPSQGGVGFLALACALLAALFLAARSGAGAVHARRAAEAAGVLLLFFPALVFPGVVTLLLSLCAFLLWWLVAQGTMENAVSSSVSVGGVGSGSGNEASPMSEGFGTRTALLADLGMRAPSRERAHSAPVTLFPWRGFLFAALGAALTALATFVPALSHTASTALVFLASLASWDQVFLAFHSTRSAPQ